MDYFNFSTLLLFGDQADAEQTDDIQSGIEEMMHMRTPIGTPAEYPRAQGHVTISVSTTFHPDARIAGAFPDLILVSSDQVYFHVHLHRILEASENGFASLLPPKSQDDGFPPAVYVSEPAEVLNVIVHTIYDLSAAQFVPSFETVSVALNAMVKYGISPVRFITPAMPLYALILSLAPHQPIEAYALAAAHDLYGLAVAISPHLLSFTLSSLTDELVVRIGPIYLKRLFFLHSIRMEALKKLLLHPPRPHPETVNCYGEQQLRLTRVWALASAHLVWDARPSA
ncbi:uncharacterized protein FIBRA_05437 [Fibroporia radiculosa]|uniref:BTB domain-containing protein n=1 Tax=Fibroporia radiculosa TaxID=599839 RepID=J4H3I0_9APHY|nr:uncharacterized protein FIBRA_05437 [Fibroporia radiculosa]CCM03309.1 predicted protein [Fibroporia radiculosa]